MLQQLLALLAMISVVFFLNACGTSRVSKLDSHSQGEHFFGDLSEMNPRAYGEGVLTSEEEEGVTKASVLTGKAHYRVMDYLKLGLTERDVAQEIFEVYQRNGASRCFSSIVGTGPNSTDLHHYPDYSVIKDGHLVVVDIGARLNGYCGDITRTYPANGKYTSRQREVVQLVQDAQNAAVAWAVPGQTSLADIDDFVREYFSKSPLRANGMTMDHFFNHGVGHFIGRHVHDSGNTTTALKNGDPFTIEPGLYIDSEEIGVRIEDVFVMTPDGLKNVAPQLIHELDEIERRIRE